MTCDCCACQGFKLFRRSADKTHLMCFQVETTVFKFLWRGVIGSCVRRQGLWNMTRKCHKLIVTHLMSVIKSEFVTLNLLTLILSNTPALEQGSAYLYHVIENTANQNTERSLYIRRYYIQPLHYAHVTLIVLATVISMAFYKIVMQRFFVVYHGMFHASRLVCVLRTYKRLVGIPYESVA